MKYLLTLLFGVSTGLVLGQSLQQNTPPSVQHISYLASERPDRILMTFGDDKGNSRIITWRTKETGNKGLIQWSSQTKEVEFYKDVYKKEAESTSLTTILGERVTYHEVILDELKPNEKYTYRVGDGVHWSEWIDFETTAADEFQFIYLGDAQNDLYPLWSRVIRAAYQRAPEARLVLHAGDLINHSQNDYEWAEWFAAGGYILSSIPQIIVPGNHEYVKNENGEKVGISPLWDPQFNFPKNAPQKLSDRAYYIDYQKVRFIALDSNDDIETQAVWLESLLKNNPQRWTIVTFHHPVISAAEGRINEGVMKNWKPLLDRYKVDMVLQGHDHVYGRGNAVNSGLGKWDEDSGTVYVVSVAGRKMYELSDHPWMQKKGQDVQTYQVINIGNDRLSYKAYTLDGDVFDAFDLIKIEGSANKLIEKLIEE
ncbi:purple acid phosphatase family protein [Penaeicola halotolerans]|uniref:purple acid phosphatase family protein n=1 Tax=Penaeicola halotolerans TaxID=2793196 RepID=UPI001CF87CE8|nr:metallophosphoesterase family protein [Penaeicola halotolerans]